MNEKIYKKLRIAQGRLDELRDVRVLGLLLFGVLVLLVSWSSVKVIDTNYRLQKQISELRQENAVDNLANQNMKLQNEYYKSEQYLELSARQNFGLAKPGETLVVIPREVALANAAPIPSDKDESSQKREKNVPAYQRNLRAWVDFFMHRDHIVYDTVN